MLRPSLTTAAVVLLGASVLAQSDLKSRIQPVTGPMRHAGVFHVATGTWTRNSSLANVTGPSHIYNNSALVGYYAPMITGERYQHTSRVPTTDALGAPTSASVFYGAPRRDEAPGSASSYTINGFQFLYCTNRVSTLPSMTWVHEFKDSYTFCGGTGTDMVPDAGQSFTVTGLPNGSATGAQICWIVDIDITPGTFALTADGDGTYQGTTTRWDSFGWSQGPSSAGIVGLGTGPIIAGNYTWTGGPAVGTLTPATGEDGTIWECPPITLGEEGTGMRSYDAFRVPAGVPSSVPSGPGCYFFGGTVHADFYLRLYSDATGGSYDCSPLVQTCLPGQGGILVCPCSNPPAGGGLGCQNFGAGPTQSGTMAATGNASVSMDTVVLQISGENNTSFSVVWTGLTPHATGVVRGGGIFCLASGLKRLYFKNASGGAFNVPTGTDPSLTARHAATGQTVSSGQTRHYQVIYRDPAAAGPCANPSSTINTTNAGSIAWGI